MTLVLCSSVRRWRTLGTKIPTKVRKLKEASENGPALAPVSKSSLSLPSLPEACSVPEALLLLRLEFSEARPGWGLVEALAASASLVSLASQLKCLKQQNNAEIMQNNQNIFLLYRPRQTRPIRLCHYARHTARLTPHCNHGSPVHNKCYTAKIRKGQKRKQ